MIKSKEDPLSEYKIKFIFRTPKRNSGLSARLKMQESKEERIKIDLEDIPEEWRIEDFGHYKSFQGNYTVTVKRAEKDTYVNNFEMEEIPTEISIILEGIVNRIYREYKK